ncbi:MAG: pyruvate, phosphate dikinase [Peptococcaceae bacterium]|jgi:pyruvate,orthophosphate dikinase|nr:pyruvate, phosphate dikinase [Peptococcaceae bacterium]
MGENDRNDKDKGSGEKKYVYLFEEGQAGMRLLLGGKGANLAEMTNIGLPVPTGLTLTTETCKAYFLAGKTFPGGMEEQLWAKLALVEKKIGKTFGDPKDPLLVSVRSGAPVSMPGLMDTILNLGLNDETVEGLIAATGNPRFALDSYRRFIQLFGDVVMGVEHHYFETALSAQKKAQGVREDKDLSADSLRAVSQAYKQLIHQQAGEEFPRTPKRQLLRAIEAVFASWYNPRADVYRQINKISEDLGTAVNVQCMVFGNMGDDSGTGVAFTRDPSTGKKALYGEYLMNAQGEDVVAGIRTPQPISKLAAEAPEVYGQFKEICGILEKHYRDMQDIEFTIQNQRLYMLQTRNGKRAAAAAVQVAVDMVGEGLITKKEAIGRVAPADLEQLLHRRVDPAAKFDALAVGLPASPGAASGKIVFNADDAHDRGGEGEKVILVRPETTPDDIHGIVKAEGILTSRGGMTSHAAVVARGMGKCCVCGCDALQIDTANKTVTVNNLVLRENDLISLDGSTGRVILGEIPLVDPEMSEAFRTFLQWADELRTMGVYTNADTPADAVKARELGAEGIGLCRTEHMFMEQERLPVMRQMILADSLERREAALDQLLPFQENDFYGILKAMDGLSVTIRLLDPPLHEFLPDSEQLALAIQRRKLIAELGRPEAAKTAETKETEALTLPELEALLIKVRALREANPMLGTRGCRLGVRYPEIYRMQAKAIFQATVRLVKEGFNPKPEVEIPLVIDSQELSIMKRLVTEEAERAAAAGGVKFHYTTGAMLELPRACLKAGELAAEADFMTFGTNDLTQTTLGFSRDDAEGKFMVDYLEQKILRENPFAVLDEEGVGALMEIAVSRARAVKPGLTFGICGEHGGDPDSIHFCHRAGLTFVSCSPFRVPIARLAAAQAALGGRDE